MLFYHFVLSTVLIQQVTRPGTHPQSSEEIWQFNEIDMGKSGFLGDEAPEVEDERVVLLQLDGLAQREKNRKPGEHPCKQTN